jgi:hypothetical protein
MKLHNYNKELISKIPENSFNIEHFVNLTINNLIYTTIKVGNPKQEIKTWIDSDEYSYFLFKDTCTLDSYYNENISLTFEPNESTTFFYHGYGQTIYINEAITLNNDINENKKEIEIQKMPIMFMKDPKNDKMFNTINPVPEITNKTCATIGFCFLGKLNDKTSKNFMLTLKEKEIIDEYTIFIDYDNNADENYLIIGGYPENTFSNKYNVKYQQTTYINFFYKYIDQWGLKFDKISCEEDHVIYQTDAAIHHNLGVIYGVKDYLSFIENNYFNFYINSNTCEKTVYKDYTMFICNKEKFSIDEMKKFPKLTFIKADLEERFDLTYEDLFYNKANKIYFLIVFHRILNEVWELGKPFLSKYSFAFNFDSKLIWYYKKINNINEKNIKENGNSFFNNEFFLIAVIIILSIILGFISFLFGRMLYNKKKKKLIKAEELTKEINEDYEKEGIN